MVLALVLIPLAIAALNPLQTTRNVAYIIGGLAGICALCILLVQPLLAVGFLTHSRIANSRRWHRWLGTSLIFLVALHVGGLYLTSPDDMRDALMLVAPTPFSLYGVIGLWALAFTALLVGFRKRMPFADITWKIFHNLLAVVVVISSVVHALMIDGAMGSLSKQLLCICVLIATGLITFHLRVLRPYLQKMP